MKNIILSIAISCVFFTTAEAQAPSTLLPQCVNAFHIKKALVNVGKNLANRGDIKSQFGREVAQSLRSRGQLEVIAQDAQRKVGQGSWVSLETILNDPRIVIVGTARPVGGLCSYRVAGQSGILFQYRY